jgi:hypothetical protein
MNHQLLDLVNRAGHVAHEVAAKCLSDQKVAVSLMNGIDRNNSKVEGALCELRLGSASGGGTFVHRNSAGGLIGSGTLAATRLIDFSFYGCDGQGVPSFLCGGRAALAVHLVGHPASNPSATIESDGILWGYVRTGQPAERRP